MTTDGLADGKGAEDKKDVADPHPSTEEHYDRIRRPGGVLPHTAPDIGPNSYANDGDPPPPPDYKAPPPK
jgi:hypothetical protein